MLSNRSERVRGKKAMNEHRHAVLIEWADGKRQRYSKEFQTDEQYRRAWYQTLQRAHKTVTVFCQCFGRGVKKLEVRHLNEANTFYLARYKNTGPEHSPDCIYYAPDIESSGLSGYSRDVVEEMSNGSLRVKLQMGLKAGVPTTSKEAAIEPISRGVQLKKPAMSLLGLLHLMWSESGLHSWTPRMAGKRNLGLVNAKLREVGQRIRAGRMLLDDVLLIGTLQAKSAHANENYKRLKQARERQLRLVIVAPLASHTDERENEVQFMRIAGFHGIPLIRIESSVWAMAKRRYPGAIRAWRQGSRVIAIVQTSSPSQEGRSVEMLSVGLMAVSSEWVPFESSYEEKVEKKLRAEARRFYKPLRFDASGDEVFPDFWLLDTPEEVPMEVFGMATPEYLERKEIKKNYYDGKHGPDGWWSWDAVVQPNEIPQFPVKRHFTRS